MEIANIALSALVIGAGLLCLFMALLFLRGLRSLAFETLLTRLTLAASCRHDHQRRGS